MKPSLLRTLGLGLMLSQPLTHTLAQAVSAMPDTTVGAAATATATACRVLAPELATGHYEGPCLDGLAHGQGVVHWTGHDAQPAYIGGFQRGQRWGHGQMHYPNGDHYAGQWRDDERSGLGEYRFGPQSPWAGDRYNGHWRANRFHGQGRYTWAMGDAYDGPWQAGQQMGPATAAQARRQAYMAALLPQLPAAGYRVCALRTASGRSPQQAWVRSVLEDRLQLETDPARPLTWQLAADWRPCTARPLPH